MEHLTRLAFTLLAACAAVAAHPASDRNGLLADSRGMTLYTFKKDAPNASSCYDGCAKAWPPFVAPAGAGPQGDFSVVSRKDGTQQWAYKSMPLYFYAGDDAPGDATGDGSGKVWHVVRGAKGGGAAKAGPSSGGYSY